MAFNQLTFAYYFAIFYLIYRQVPESRGRARNLVLLAFSYFFYYSWDPRFLLLLLASTVVNYGLGLALEGPPARRKAAFAAAIAWNLGVLAFFKYFNFFAETAAAFLDTTLDSPLIAVGLPLGISFYTFQVLSYPIDIRRGVIKPTRDFGDFALFVAFFPNMIAGPIERARTLLPQIASPRPVTPRLMSEGGWLVFWGLFKKIAIADNFAKITGPVFDLPTSSSTPEVLIAMYLFAIQIYADFSGCADVARGLAKWMGFEIVLNFKTPFFAGSLPALWQRWHMSLTNWIKEYVFYPLALWRFRGRSLDPALVIVVTWVLMGVWHGPTALFALWGFYHAALLVVYNMMLPRLNRVRPKAGAALGAWHAASVFVTFHLFMLGLLCFAVKLPEELVVVFEAFFRNRSVVEGMRFSLEPLRFMALFALPLFVVEWAQFRTDDEFAVFRWPAWIRAAFYYFCFYLTVFYGVFGARQYFYQNF